MPHLLLACSAWKAADFIDDAIGSALAAPLPDGWTRSTIIGVDGCPDTLTAALRVRDRYPGVMVASFDKTDVYRVRNALADLGGSWDAMGVVDADDVYLWNRWTATLPALADAGIVSALSVLLGADLSPDIPLKDMPIGWEGGRRWVGYRRFCHPTAVIRRDAWDLLGGYDNRWPMGSDTFLFETAIARGITTSRLGQVVTAQRIHPIQLTHRFHVLHPERQRVIRETEASLKDGTAPVLCPAIPVHLYEARR